MSQVQLSLDGSLGLPACVQCNAVFKMLDKVGISYEKVDLTVDDEAREYVMPDLRATPVIRHGDESPGSMGMCSMLNPADVQGVIVGEGPKCHAIPAAARDAPPFQLEP
jgi:glutaredoxin